MAIAAAGPISLAEDALALSLADSTTFRSFVGATDQAQALKRVHLTGLPPPADRDVYTLDELHGLRPYALVFTAGENGYRRDHSATGVSHEFIEGGSLTVQIVRDVPFEIRDHDAQVNRDFLNALGLIMKELADLAGKAGYLAVESVTLASGPFRSSEDEIKADNDAQRAELLVDWGIEQ